MADGQILIDSRIQTDEAKKDTQDLKKQLESLADSASVSAKNIEKSFNSLSIEDAAEGLGESFQKEAQEVKDIPDQIQKEFDDIDLEDVADGLADGFGEEADKTKEHSKETEKAIEALTDKIKRQEKELGTLKTAYINARSEYGETADETQRLAREIEELSTELKQSQQEFEDASKAADHLDKTLDDINPPEGMQGFMEGFIGGIASGLTQKAIDMLGELGRAMIEGLRTDSLYLGSIRVSQLLAAVSCLAAVAVLTVMALRPHSPDKLFVNRMAAREAPQEEPAEENPEAE